MLVKWLRAALDLFIKSTFYSVIFVKVLITLSRTTAISLSWSIQDGNCSRRDFWESWRKTERVSTTEEKRCVLFNWEKHKDIHTVLRTMSPTIRPVNTSHSCMRHKQTRVIQFYRALLAELITAHLSCQSRCGSCRRPEIETSSFIQNRLWEFRAHTHTYVLLEEFWVHSLHKVQRKHQLIRL